MYKILQYNRLNIIVAGEQRNGISGTDVCPDK